MVLNVTSGNDSAKIAGLLVGLAGPLMLSAGVLEVILGWAASTCDVCSENKSQENVGFGLVLAGTAATAVGWGVYGTTGSRVESSDA